MNTNIKSLLEKMLSIIEYQNDRDAFINEFIDLCTQTAFLEYMNLLPEERKREVQQILHEKKSEKLKENIEPYIETEEYKRLLQENTKKLFLDYLETIMPTLSEEQKNNLDSYLSSIKPATQQVSSQTV